jgi:hypothetical protein
MLAAAATAQTPAPTATRYRFAAGDTLLYHVQAVDSSTLTTPQGQVPVVTMTESTMRLVFGTNGAARAAFTALKVLARTPQGTLAPATDGALKLPFALTISDRGQVRVTATPIFPEELTKVSDPSTEFDDYFQVLPVEPLRLGLTWVDTVTQTGASATGLKYTRHLIGSFAVARDTTVGGRHCFVITATSEQVIDASGPGPGPTLTVTNHQTGTENGLVIFDPARGRMMARQRVGDFKGTLHLDGGPQPMDLPLTRRYLSGLELLP